MALDDKKAADTTTGSSSIIISSYLRVGSSLMSVCYQSKWTPHLRISTISFSGFCTLFFNWTGTCSIKRHANLPPTTHTLWKA